MAGPEQVFQSGDQGLRRAADGHQQFTYPDAFSPFGDCLQHDSERSNQTLIAQGVLPEVRIDQSEAVMQQRPRVGYHDGDGRWHFRTSDNDIAGQLKEAGWNGYPWFSHRANPEAHYDKAAAELSATVFPNLRKFSDKMDAPLLIEAIARNEQMYYDQFDALIDGWVNLGYDGGRFTLGNEQMKPANIDRLMKKYPDVFGNSKDSHKCALDTFTGTLLIGGYLDDQIDRFEAWSNVPPDRNALSSDDRLLFDHAFPLWQRGEYLNALARSYNPGDPFHMQNVLHHVDRLKESR